MDEKPNERSEADAELEREIRKERKFTLAEAIGRMAGPGAMKGASPISRAQQSEIEIQDWLRLHLPADPYAAVSVRHVLSEIVQQLGGPAA